MISLPEQTVWSLADLKSAQLGAAVVWASASVKALVARELSLPMAPALQDLPPQTQTLVVVGGGYLIDEAKAWIQDKAPTVRLIAVPSIWGSGAEASPIIVQNRDGKKMIRMEAAFLPKVRVIWPELATSIPEKRAREALGDCWANALEGFLSPVADDALRQRIATLMKQMLELPLGKDPRWFELGAQASAAQAQSSVGLVHGIAHTLEGPLIAAQPQEEWGHAKLCGLYLWPVTQFNFQNNPSLAESLSRYGLDSSVLLRVSKELYSADLYDKALPLLQECWMSVLRDRCTRTNSVLVKPAHLQYFVDRSFQ